MNTIQVEVPVVQVCVSDHRRKSNKSQELVKLTGCANMSFVNVSFQYSDWQIYRSSNAHLDGQVKIRLFQN